MLKIEKVKMKAIRGNREEITSFELVR